MTATEGPDPDLSRSNVRLGVVVLVILLGVVGLGLLRSRGGGGPAPVSSELRASLERAGCRLDDRTDPGRHHIPNATYTVDPPSGGDHDPVPAPAGFYATTDVPSDGHLVHSLEHGFVIVWYQPASTSEPTLDALRTLARKHRWVLVAPRPSMPAALAATAWHRRLLCPPGDATSGPIGDFVTAFRNQGPEKGFV
ncbi:MAG TPA: DUF3105 domain-containing protein [Acidimicrobiia bacterium]|nr:DUF3105 domain-containing protein [Acidimicrobiia bacterium]